MQELKKIVIIGPESTGKSTLCELLANHFNTKWVAEYARAYLLANGKEYTYDNLLTVAKEQLADEDKISFQSFISSAAISGSHLLTQRSPLLFIDTDMYVMKVWCEFVFGKCHQWILDQIAVRKYDLYLLCRTDLPWVKDELREYPDLKTREKLFHVYKDLLVNQSTPWVEIQGQPEERLQTAIEATNSLFDEHK